MLNRLIATIIFGFAFIHFHSYNCFAQNENVQNKLDSTLIKEIANLYLNAYELISTNPIRAISMGEKIITLSEKDNYFNGKGYGYSIVGIANRKQLNYSYSIANLNQALKFFKLGKDSSNIANTYIELGICYSNCSMFDNAVESYINAINTFESIKDTTEKGRTLYNLANVYGNFNNSQKALEYYNIALELFKKLNSKLGIAMCNMGIADQYYDQAQYDTAQKLYFSCLEIFKNASFKPALVGAYRGIANIYSKKKKYKLAMEYYNQAVTIAKEQNLTFILSDLYSHIADIKIAENNFNEGIALLKAAEDLLINTSNFIEIKKLYSNMSDVFEKNGNYQEALKYSKLINLANDSIYKIEMHKKAIENELKYSIKEKDKFIELLSNDKKIKELESRHESNSVKLLFVLSLFLLFLVSILIWIIFTNKKRSKQKINMEMSLRESEEKFRTILNTSPDGIAISSLDGTLQLVTPKTLTMLEYNSKEEIIGKNVIEFVHPQDQQKAQYFIGQMLEGNMTGTAEYLMLKKNGDTLCAESNANILKDSLDRPIGIIYVMRDISKRKQAEEILRENYDRLDLAMDTAKMAWWEMDVVSGLVKFNKRKTDMLGYPFENFNHFEDFMRLVHKDDYNKAMRIMKEHFLGIRDKYETEYRILTSSGYYKWFYDIGSIVNRDADGKPLRITGLVLDVSERKQDEEEQQKLLEQLKESHEIIELTLFQKNVLIEELSEAKEQLEKTNATKDKFFSIIAHDLKNPLGSFREATKLLHESYFEFDESERIEFLEIMKNSSENIYNLLWNLLEWSNSQRGTLDFHPDNIDLFLVVVGTIKLLKLSSDHKNISLTNKIKGSTNIYADINLVTTIIRNLISNAIKFTPEGGMIEIGAVNKPSEGLDPSEGSIQIYVKDSGIGMKKETIEKLFRIDQSLTTIGTNNEKGTGLGLILCKEFVEKHSGKIWVESEEGKGSTFWFTIRK